MYLVVGLGNPGARYVDTRHNVGFRIAEAFAEQHRVVFRSGVYNGLYGVGTVSGHEVGILLPHTFMNRSGEAVRAAVDDHPQLDAARDLIVLVDDLDLPFGRLRVRQGGSSGGHRGLESLIAWLETEAFSRIRFGIGRPEQSLDAVEYVLAPFAAAEASELSQAVVRATQAIEAIFQDGIQAAMGHYNAPAEPPPES